MTNIVLNSAFDILYLCGCVLTNQKPNIARLSSLNLKELYELSQFHSITALVCEGLELSEYIPSEENQEFMNAFQVAKNKSIRKNLMLDIERSKIISFMEKNCIWYMPLKGVILKDMYPKMGLRQMADNDILFDKNYREIVHDWFIEQNYKNISYGIRNHDVYLKNPIYNYEMHVALYDEHNTEWNNYYKTIKSRLVKDDNNNYGYHFTDEDFYIYFLSHGFKHFDNSGTGLRFLLDMYIYLEKKNSQLDFVYIKKELQKLGLIEFEQNCRELVSQIFTDIHAFEYENLTNKYREMLLYFITSGTYGTIVQQVQIGIYKYGKIKYILWRIFPGTQVLKSYHPIFKHKWLIPIGWIYRAFKIITSRFDNAVREIRIIIKSKRT